MNKPIKMTAYSCLIEKDMEGACRILCKYAHRYPGKIGSLLFENR